MTTTETRSTDLVPRVAPELDMDARLGKWLAALESGSDNINAKGAAAALRFYYARELGLPPTAVAELPVIKGKLFVGAQLLRALAARAGYRVVRTDDDETTCTAQLVRADNGEIVGETTFTIEDAKRAGLIRAGSAWQTHPARMCWARSSSYVIRDFAPEVALGLALDDEIPEYTGEIVHEEDLGTTPDDDVDWPAPDATNGDELGGAGSIDRSDVERELERDDEPQQEALADRAQLRRIFAMFGERGLGAEADREIRVAWTSKVIGREIESSNELTAREALTVIDELRKIPVQTASDPPAGEQAVERELRDAGAREVPRFEPPPSARARIEQLAEGTGEGVPFNEFPEGF
jgi:hypothetical protein